MLWKRANMSLVDKVAAAICFAARHEQDRPCRVCDGVRPDQCQMIEQFRTEALAAIHVVRKHK